MDPHHRALRSARKGGPPGPGPSADTADTLTASEQKVPPEEPESSPSQSFQTFSRQGGKVLLGRASLRVPNYGMTPSNMHGARNSVSSLPHPHYSTRGGLLYRVVEKEGVVTEQLVVPRPYVSKVLFMAHTHLLGAHLGMDKTRDRVLARFYWPG